MKLFTKISNGGGWSKEKITSVLAALSGILLAVGYKIEVPLETLSAIGATLLPIFYGLMNFFRRDREDKKEAVS